MTNCHVTGCRHLETRCKDCGRLVADRILPPPCTHEHIGDANEMVDKDATGQNEFEHPLKTLLNVRDRAMEYMVDKGYCDPEIMDVLNITINHISQIRACKRQP